MHSPLAGRYFTKALTGGGGPAFESHGFHIILNQYNDATWRPMIGPRGIQPQTKNCHVSKHDSPNCQPIKNCHITSATSVYSAMSACTDCTDCTVSVPFFACLTIRTDRNISRSRRLFEPERVVLGS
jgi:hypothetical protein